MTMHGAGLTDLEGQAPHARAQEQQEYDDRDKHALADSYVSVLDDPPGASSSSSIVEQGELTNGYKAARALQLEDDTAIDQSKKSACRQSTYA